MSLLLGVDPGLTRCGLAILESSDQSLVETLVLKSPASAPAFERVGLIASGVAALLEKHQIRAIALERVFAQANLRSVMGVAQISGAIMFLAHNRGIPVEFFTPTEVKLSVCGNGRATKPEVISTISRLYPNQLKTRFPDEADAVAISLCAARRGVTNETPAQRAWLDAARKAKGKLG